MAQEINYLVAGEAGQGVQSAGFLLGKALARYGYHVFADQDYESRVRGGHNFFRVRASRVPVSALTEAVDILIIFNRESLELHKSELSESGVIIYDGEKITDVKGNGIVNVPAERLAIESAGDRIMSNTVLLGAGLRLVGYEFEQLAEILREFFPVEAGENNVKAALAGYDYVNSNGTVIRNKLEKLDTARRMLLNGNEAMALGAIAAGCKFMSAYPMTPVTGIMEYLAGKAKDYNIVVVPAEDEIAAINMVVGAAYAGVRAITATSGGGFCLMVEGIGLAGITETPVVIINGQRPGPAIGLPTRTEQSDLEFVLHTAHGEFPRVVLAPATVEESFWSVVKGFNLAERYQVPVIILTDHHLTSSYATVEKFDLSRVTIDRGSIYTGGQDNEYRRYAFTESGVSARAFPGKSRALVNADSDEHDEAGHPIEDASIRTSMMRKRMRKFDGLKQEITLPVFYGSDKAETLLVSWGSTYGAVREAVDILQKENIKVNLLHITGLWPFPVEHVNNYMEKAKRVYAVENNATGQLARLIRRETGRQVNAAILKYDGRPFSPEIIVKEVRDRG